ncbi:MAG: hypothetical protein K0S99_772 [Thermomicrobiales bacterium]|nr:hypothetical protein [Thermomicrobiales bacterium]
MHTGSRYRRGALLRASTIRAVGAALHANADLACTAVPVAFARSRLPAIRHLLHAPWSLVALLTPRANTARFGAPALTRRPTPIAERLFPLARGVVGLSPHLPGRSLVQRETSEHRRQDAIRQATERLPEGLAATRASVSASNRRSSMNASRQISIGGDKPSAPWPHLEQARSIGQARPGAPATSCPSAGGGSASRSLRVMTRAAGASFLGC